MKRNVGSEYNNEWINGPNVRLFNKLTIGATVTSDMGKYTKLEQKDNYTDTTDYEASRTDWDKYESIY